MRIVRIRRAGGDDEGTPGRLYTRGFSCYSIELPWRNNAPEISCLPAGGYFARHTWSKKFRRFMYELVEDIPDRGGFRIHSGNYAGDRTRGLRTDSLGCPLLGYQFGRMHGQRAILVSRPAVADFVAFMDAKPFVLEIS